MVEVEKKSDTSFYFILIQVDAFAQLAIISFKKNCQHVYRVKIKSDHIFRD